MSIFNPIQGRSRMNGIRAARRIPLRIKFKVVGQDDRGYCFEEQAESLVISAAGGCFCFDQNVKEGDDLTLVGSDGRSFLVSVRWFKHDRVSSVRYVGFKLHESGKGWVIGDGQAVLGRPSPDLLSKEHNPTILGPASS